MRRAVAAGCVVFGLIGAACGARTPLIVDETCHGEVIPVSGEVPTLYYVLDHSRSMIDEDKWEQVRAALAKVMSKVDARARFAVVIYPHPTDGVCAPGQEVMAPQRGNGVHTVQQFLLVTAPPPNGGTPTADTLDALATKLTGSKNTFVVLATDGGPNCNLGIMCDVDRCILNVEELNGCKRTGPSCCMTSSQNCLDDARAVKAVTRLKSAGVSTYVVGIPGSDVYGPVLDAMAAAGGTARPSAPRYYKVDSPEALSGSLLEITEKVLKGCTLTLEREPLYPKTMRVRVRGTWRSEFTAQGSALTLSGQACADYDGDVAELRVEDGCAVEGR